MGTRVSLCHFPLLMSAAMEGSLNRETHQGLAPAAGMEDMDFRCKIGGMDGLNALVMEETKERAPNALAQMVAEMKWGG